MGVELGDRDLGLTEGWEDVRLLRPVPYVVETLRDANELLCINSRRVSRSIHITHNRYADGRGDSRVVYASTITKGDDYRVCVHTYSHTQTGTLTRDIVM